MTSSLSLRRDHWPSVFIERDDVEAKLKVLSVISDSRVDWNEVSAIPDRQQATYYNDNTARYPSLNHT